MSSQLPPPVGLLVAAQRIELPQAACGSFRRQGFGPPLLPLQVAKRLGSRAGRLREKAAAVGGVLETQAIGHFIHPPNLVQLPDVVGFAEQALGDRSRTGLPVTL